MMLTPHELTVDQRPNASQAPHSATAGKTLESATSAIVKLFFDYASALVTMAHGLLE